MIKWVIRGLSEYGQNHVSEIETEEDSACDALTKFSLIHGWGRWLNIDIDRLEDGE